MNTKAILFDADGVVIRSQQRFSDMYVEKFDADPEVFARFFANDFKKCASGKADLKEQLIPYLEELKWEKSVEEFLEMWFESENQVDDMLFEIIQGLRDGGIICSLATNNEKYRTEYLKATMKFSEKFDYIFSSADIGFVKPQAQYYEHIIKLLKNKHNIDVSEILYLDDTIKNIDGAQSVGITSYHYTEREPFEQYLAKHGIN